MAIFITTSNGVYRLPTEATHEDLTPKVVMQKKTSFWPFSKGDFGFFGVAHWATANMVLVAARTDLGTPKVDKKATDTRLYAMDPNSLQTELFAEIKDIHDVHQICIHQDNCFLTDTGKNRVHVYDLNRKEVTHLLNVGDERDDINHINAVSVVEDHLLVGLNNRGHSEAAILKIPLKRVLDAHQRVSSEQDGETMTLAGLFHTHDIEPLEQGLLVCSSHTGEVFRVGQTQALLKANDWVRGLVATKEGLWVGASPLADRSERHREDLDGQVYLYTSQAPWTKKRSVFLKGCGQVNDLIEVS